MNDTNIIYTYTTIEAERDGILLKVEDPCITHITRSVYAEFVESLLEIFPDNEAKAKYTHMVLTGLIAAVKRAVALEGKQVQTTPNFMFLDSFYEITLLGHRFFLCKNELDTFTLMFPEDY